MRVTLPRRCHEAAIAETAFERAHGFPAPRMLRRGRGCSYVYDGLTAAQAEALAERLEHVGEVFTGVGSHPDDRGAGRACRLAAAKIREQLARARASP